MPLNSQKLSLLFNKVPKSDSNFIWVYIAYPAYNNPILLKELPQKRKTPLQYFYYKYSIVHKFNFVKSFLNKIFPNKKPPLYEGVKFKLELKTD